MAKDIETLEASTVVGKDARFAIVAGRFNEFIVERLVEGALGALQSHGVGPERVTLTHAPGAFEIPLVCQRFAASGKVAAVVALGCVIRGSTPHFDYVCSSVASGCSSAALSTGVPIIFGVLTTDTIEQAIERAGTKLGNKGHDAAMAALQMVSLGSVLGDAGY